MLTTILVVAGLGALSVALTVWASIGRRVGREPRCRRCRFDLSGTLNSAAAGACPECGAGLDQPRAIATGLRRARRGLLAVCIAMMLICAGLTGALIVGQSANAQAAKPAWWLVLEARYAAPAVSDAAATELHARAVAGAISLKSHPTLIGATLIVQRDSARAWDGTSWQALLGLAETTGLLTPEQIASVNTAVADAFVITAGQARINPGSDIPGIALSLTSPPRLSDRFNEIHVAAEPIAVRLNGAPLLLNIALPRFDDMRWRTSSFSRRYGPNSGGWGSSSTHWSQDLLSTSDWPIGTHTIEVDWVVRWIDPAAISAAGGHLSGIQGFPAPEHIVATRRVTTSSEVVVFDPTKPETVIELVTGDTDWPEGNTASPQAVVMSYHSRTIIPPELNMTVIERDGVRVIVPIDETNSKPPPIIYTANVMLNLQRDWSRPRDQEPAIHHHVWLLVDGERVPVEWWGARQCVISAGHSNVLGQVTNLPRIERVDVLLTPDVLGAARDTSVKLLWNKDILIRDVPVDWSEVDAVNAREAQGAQHVEEAPSGE